MFVQPFKAGANYSTRNSVGNCTALVSIKDFKALIDNTPFFDQPVKTNKKRMQNLFKCQETMTMQQETY